MEPDYTTSTWMTVNQEAMTTFMILTTAMLATYEEPMGKLFMTEQMSLKKGLKHFEKSGVDMVVAEM